MHRRFGTLEPTPAVLPHSIMALRVSTCGSPPAASANCTGIRQMRGP
jgi:hypothetical protein